MDFQRYAPAMMRPDFFFFVFMFGLEEVPKWTYFNLYFDCPFAFLPSMNLYLLLSRMTSTYQARSGFTNFPFMDRIWDLPSISIRWAAQFGSQRGLPKLGTIFQTWDPLYQEARSVFHTNSPS